MFKLKNVAQLKTTLIGLALIGYACYLQFVLFQNNSLEFNYPVACVSVVGLTLLFAPDTLIDALKKVIGGRRE